MKLLETLGMDVPWVRGSSRIHAAFVASWGMIWGTSLGLLLFAVSAAQAVADLEIAATNFMGGVGNQRATGVAIAGDRLHFSGSTDANGGDGLSASLDLPLTNGATAAWSVVWPNLANVDDLMGMAASTDGVFAVGYSYGRTSDTAGGKEIKGITVKFRADGVACGGYGGAIWDVQTPAAPGAMPYGGGESLQGCVLVEEGGVPYLYATGSGQANGLNGGRMFLSKLNSSGSILWTRTDAASMVNNAYSTGVTL